MGATNSRLLRSHWRRVPREEGSLYEIQPKRWCENDESSRHPNGERFIQNEPSIGRGKRLACVAAKQRKTTWCTIGSLRIIYIKIFMKMGKSCRMCSLSWMYLLVEKGGKGNWTVENHTKGNFFSDDKMLETEKSGCNRPVVCSRRRTLMTRRQTQWHSTSVRPTSSQKTQIHTEKTGDGTDEGGRPATRRKLNNPTSAFVKIHGRNLKRRSS